MSDPRHMSIKELKAAISTVLGESAFKAKNFVEKSEFVNFLIEHNEKLIARRDGITIVPAGKYILGDPCFAVTDVLHLETFNETYYDSEDEDKAPAAVSKKNKNKAKPVDSFREARFNASTVVTAFNTFSNDGPTWFSEKNGGRSFLINSGVVALVPLSYNPHFAPDGGVAHVVEFSSPASCFAKRGILHFGDIQIDTKKPAAPKRSQKPAAGRKRKADDYEDESEIEEHVDMSEEEEELFSGDDSTGDEWVPEEADRRRSHLKKRKRQPVAHGSSSEAEAEFDD